jgi:hypothetical protein
MRREQGKDAAVRETWRSEEIRGGSEETQSNPVGSE